jgi:hypothetical protein
VTCDISSTAARLRLHGASAQAPSAAPLTARYTTTFYDAVEQKQLVLRPTVMTEWDLISVDGKYIVFDTKQAL